MDEEPTETQIKWILKVIGGILILGLIAVFSPFTTIGAGERGVVLYFGAVENKVLGEGFHVITPIVEDVIKLDVRTQKYETNAEAATKDLMDVKTTVAINYHLNPQTVNSLYQDIGLEYQDRVIAPAVQEIVKATTAKYDAEQLITLRENVKDQLEERLKERLKERNILVETISITNFQFPQQFNDAVTMKQTALQKKLTAENDLLRIEVEAKQALARAEGEAKSITVVNEQLIKSPVYIQFLAVQKWNGVLPLATGSGAIPFIEVDKKQ